MARSTAPSSCAPACTVAGKTELTDADLLAAFEAGLEGVQQRGKAAPGEKTMVDALTPPRCQACAARSTAAPSLDETLEPAAAAAEQGMKATIPMLATKGRASYLGERSIGHQDPGATSSYLMLRCAADSLDNCTLVTIRSMHGSSSRP